MTHFSPQSRQDNLVVQQTQKEILLYDLAINKAFRLNETAALIWLECDGKKDVSSILASVSKITKHNASPAFVQLALRQLANQNLLTDNEFWLEQTADLSRRSAIKQIGFATLLTLPVITAIVAPKAIQAASSATCVKPNSGGAVAGTVVGYCSLGNGRRM